MLGKLRKDIYGTDMIFMLITSTGFHSCTYLYNVTKFYLLNFAVHVVGNPSDGLLGSDFTLFKPIKVMPTFIIWWIDTVEGIATICILILVFIVIVVTTIVCICKKCKWCCFKEK